MSGGPAGQHAFSARGDHAGRRGLGRRPPTAVKLASEYLTQGKTGAGIGAPWPMTWDRRGAGSPCGVPADDAENLYAVVTSDPEVTRYLVCRRTAVSRRPAPSSPGCSTSVATAPG